MKNVILLSLILFLFSNCEKEDFARKGEGILIKRAHCNWIIEIEEGEERSFLELRNIEDFDIEPAEGIRVFYKCKQLENLGSACQMGRIVELTKLKEIE